MRVGARLFKGLWAPASAAGIVYGLEELTGAMSWAFLQLFSAAAEWLIEMMKGITWPASPDWGVMPVKAVQMLYIAGVWQALAVVIAAGILRLMVKIMTLGRF